MTIILLLHFGNKNLKEIQQIVISTEVVNRTKHIIYQKTDLIIISDKS